MKFGRFAIFSARDWQGSTPYKTLDLLVFSIFSQMQRITPLKDPCQGPAPKIANVSNATIGFEAKIRSCRKLGSHA
jgi:hypothetical protein